MEVALYMRVSTSRQQQHQTIEQQLSRLHAYVALQPDWHVADEHIYRDDGYSGATLKRPGLDRLRDRAAMAAFECVLMTTPDRLHGTMCTRCSWSMNSPNVAVVSSVSSGP